MTSAGKTCSICCSPISCTTSTYTHTWLICLRRKQLFAFLLFHLHLIQLRFCGAENWLQLSKRMVCSWGWSWWEGIGIPRKHFTLCLLSPVIRPGPRLGILVCISTSRTVLEPVVKAELVKAALGAQKAPRITQRETFPFVKLKQHPFSSALRQTGSPPTVTGLTDHKQTSHHRWLGLGRTNPNPDVSLCAVESQVRGLSPFVSEAVPSLSGQEQRAHGSLLSTRWMKGLTQAGCAAAAKEEVEKREEQP